MSFISQFLKFCNFYKENRNVVPKNKSYCIGNRFVELGGGVDDALV